MNQPVLDRYQKKILDLRELPLVLRSLTAGSSKAARLSSVQKSEHLQCVWNTAADVIAPAFLFFTWWILENVKRSGARRLYFLSRDGQILQKIALALNEKFGYGIECRYLYVSRKACYLPALDGIGDFETDWVMVTDSDRSLSINKISERLDLHPDDISDILIKYGFKKDGWGEPLPSGALYKLKKCLKDDALQKIVISKAAAAYKNASGYLLQEALGTPGEICVVDLGWHGRIQYAISKILDKTGIRSAAGLRGFYFGIAEYRKSYKNDTGDSFLPLTWPMTLKDYMTINFTLYEIFAGADHGMVTGYSEKDGVYYPALNRQNNDEAISWGIRTQQESVIKFAEIFIKNYGSDMPAIKYMRTISEALLCEFIQNPSTQEAAVYGSYMHDAAMTEKALREVAPVISYREIFLIGVAPHQNAQRHILDDRLIRKVSHAIYE